MKIDKVAIKNFKSLRDIKLDLGNLTLITGINSVGKSSFIQALLLLKQNENIIEQTISLESIKRIMEKEKLNDKIKNFIKNNIHTIILNNENGYVELGNYADTLYQDSVTDEISISLDNNEKYFKVSYNSDLNINVEDSSPNRRYHFNLFNQNFQYICTDRISPNITYPLSEIEIKKNLIGFQGEYTAHYLTINRHKKLDIENLRHQNSQTNRLFENVSLWLGEISSGIDMSTKIYSELQRVSLTYSYTYGENTTNEFTPLNIGFGVTYVLPIIVAILKAKPNDLLIIENPESHLHPAGQSKIAELCAIASANGVQIIVETHSDHFLNGIRVATKKGLLTPEQSKIYYFRKDKDELETKIDEINIDKEGGIDNYPKGFFDQFDDDLDELLGL